MRRDKILFINSTKKLQRKCLAYHKPKKPTKQEKYVLHGLSVSQMEICKHN